MTRCPQHPRGGIRKGKSLDTKTGVGAGPGFTVSINPAARYATQQVPASRAGAHETLPLSKASSTGGGGVCSLQRVNMLLTRWSSIPAIQASPCSKCGFSGAQCIKKKLALQEKTAAVKGELSKPRWSCSPYTG